MNIRIIDENELKSMTNSSESNEDFINLYGSIEMFDLSFEVEPDESGEEHCYNSFINNDESDAELNVIINYPLSVTAIATVKARTIMELGYRICDAYKQIYEEERNSTEIPEGYIEGMYNRNRTNGKYGIWGHDISDLILEGIKISGNVVSISVGS